MSNHNINKHSKKDRTGLDKILMSTRQWVTVADSVLSVLLPTQTVGDIAKSLHRAFVEASER